MITKEEIDKHITNEWDRLEGIVKSYIATSKFNICDVDVMGFGYEYLLKNRDKLKSNIDITIVFLNICKKYTQWYRGKYLYHYRRKEIYFSECLNDKYDHTDYMFEDNIETNLDHSEYYNYKENHRWLDTCDEYIEKFRKLNSRFDNIILDMLLKGMTVDEFSEYTNITRSTGYKLIKGVKNKLRYMKIKDEYNGKVLTKNVKGLEIKFDTSLDYSNDQLERFKLYFKEIFEGNTGNTGNTGDTKKRKVRVKKKDNDNNSNNNEGEEERG